VGRSILSDLLCVKKILKSGSGPSGSGADVLVAGGIGYTNVFPIEKMIRDTRLIQIWTGTNDIMNLLIQHEYYRELLKDPNPGRMIEADAEEAAQSDEKVYEDDEMWTKGW
jgi:hypothetical protein